MSFEDKFDDSLFQSSKDVIHSQILNDLGLGSEADEVYSRMGRKAKIVYPSIARDVDYARKELKKSQSLSNSENFEATTAATFSKYHSTTPFPLEARYNTLSKWIIPNDPAVQSAYFDITQLIIFREASLLKLEDCSNRMDNNYWKYAVLRINSKINGKSLNSKLLVQKRITIRLIQKEFAVAMAHLRALSIQVVEAIIKWRSKIRSVVITKETASIYWNNTNYIIKINNDCHFLSKYFTVKLWLGFTPSAFMIPPINHNPKDVCNYRKELKKNWQEIFEKTWLEKIKVEKAEKIKNYKLEVFVHEADEIALKEPTPPKPEVVDALEEVLNIILTGNRKSLGKRVINAEQGINYNWREKYFNYEEVNEQEIILVPFELSIKGKCNKFLAAKEEMIYAVKLNEYNDQKARWAVAAREKNLMDKEDVFYRNQFILPFMEELYLECESRHKIQIESERVEMKLEDFDRHYVIEGILRCKWDDYENASNDGISALITISPSVIGLETIKRIEIKKEEDNINFFLHENYYCKEVNASELLTDDICEFKEQEDDNVSDIIKEDDFLSPNIDVNQEDNESDYYFEKLITDGIIENNKEGNIDIMNGDSQNEFFQNKFFDNNGNCSVVNQSQNINVNTYSEKTLKNLTNVEDWMILRDICHKSFPKNSDGSFSDDVTAEDDDSKLFWGNLNHNPLVLEASVGYEDIFPTIYLVPPISNDLKVRCAHLSQILKDEEISEKALYELEQKCHNLKSNIHETIRLDCISEIEHGSRLRQSITDFEMLRYRQQSEQITRAPFLISSLDENRSFSTLSKVDWVDDKSFTSTFNDDNNKIFEFTQQSSDFFHDDYLIVHNSSRTINTMPSLTMKSMNEIAVGNERKLICKVNNKLQLKQDILNRTNRKGRLFNKYSIIWKNKAAFIIQQMIRSYFARKKVNTRRILRKKNKGATYIQKLIRGYLGRKRYSCLKNLMKAQSITLRKTILAKKKGSNVITSIVRRAVVEKSKLRQDSIQENLIIKNQNIGANQEKVRRMSVLLQFDKFGTPIIPKIRDMTPTGEAKRTKLPPILANDNEVEDELECVADDTSVISAEASLISDTSVKYIESRVKSLLSQNMIPTKKNLNLLEKMEYMDVVDAPISPLGSYDENDKPFGSINVQIPILKELHSLIDDKLFTNASDIRIVPRRSAVYSPPSDMMNIHRKAQEKLVNNNNSNNCSDTSFDETENIILKPSEIVFNQMEKDNLNNKVSPSTIKKLLMSPNIDGIQNSKKCFSDFDSKSISSAPSSIESVSDDNASLSSIDSVAPIKVMKFKPSLFLMKSYSKLVPMQKVSVPNTQSVIKQFAAKDRAFFNSTLDTKAHSLITSPNEMYHPPAGIVRNSKDKHINAQPTPIVMKKSQSEPILKTDGIDASLLKTLIFR